MKFFKPFSLLCCLGIVFFDMSCTKKSQDHAPAKVTNDTLVYNFTWTGIPELDSVITFSAPEAAGTTYKWDFGDRYMSIDTSTLPSPSFRFHYFTGTFTVTLVLNKDTAHRISKAITIYSNTLSNSFSYSGVPCVGNTLSFTANEPYETQYLWSFGDGPATSTATNPVHSYSVAGAYTITMTLNATTSATQSITIYPAPSSAVPGGAYHWSHKHIDYSTGVGPFDSSFTTDTLLALTSINPTTLTFLGSTFFYSPASSTGGLLAFNFSTYTNPAQNYYANGGLVYLPATDSMYCNIWTHPGPGQGVTFTDSYYTHH